jgi:long-chain fatty acid transport protein
MRQNRFAVLVCLAVCLAPGLADSAAASGFSLFQHGGRAMGQAGAFTARAPEPSAVTYNPAAITRLEGFQAQAGLDFNHSRDDYDSPTGSFAAKHIIQFPPSLYATWTPEESSWSFGLGFDTPFYQNLDWQPVAFPGRFLTRRFELRVWEVHPVLAWKFGEGWSVGGGVRYVFGDLAQEDNGRFLLQVQTPGGTVPIPVEVERNAEADVDDLGWDLALHFDAPAWGWGAVYRSPVQLEGNGRLDYNPRDVPSGFPDLDAQLRGRFADGSSRQSFEIPRELRGGVWYAPYPELRLELDASYQSWSSLENTDVTYDPDGFGDGPTVTTRRDWDDTLSLRLGLEGDITERFVLFGGIAWEPSPVPGGRVEPGFPRGDATVYATGFSYNFPQLSFDVGYSFHDHDSQGASGQEPFNPGVSGTYSAKDQVWGVSARWRF